MDATTTTMTTTSTPDHSAIIMLLAGLILTLAALSALCAILLKWYRWNHTYGLLRGKLPTATEHLPPVIAAHLLDHSDTSDLYPDPEHCGECYLLWLHFDYHATARTADGGYVQPSGAAHPCEIHQQTPLGAALRRKETAR